MKTLSIFIIAVASVMILFGVLFGAMAAKSRRFDLLAIQAACIAVNAFIIVCQVYVILSGIEGD